MRFSGKLLFLLAILLQISCERPIIEPKVVVNLQNNFNGLIVLKTDALCIRYSKDIIFCGSSDGSNQSCFVRIYLK